MKDTAITYDIVHHQQQQHHSWNHPRQHQHQQQQQQHQTHTTSVYANQQPSTQQQQQQQQATSASQTQRSALGHQQQNQQHAAAQLGQYQQQLQSTAAYYQQAHLYPTYQAHAHSQDQQQPQQQQQPQHPTVSDHQQHGQHHHGHPGPAVPATGAAASVVNAAVVAAQQQHASVHHSDGPNNTQASALNHAGWSPGVGTMAPQAHHAIVTDHSTLAYMTHAYQSHNTTVNDHHRGNSDGPMSNQPIGTGPQASSYTVDTLYNPPAAAVAAYGYNNYNAAFFQTSNNGPHTQTGHPTPANMSNFWNHNQASQQRTAHSQAINNQPSVEQRQPIASEQTANYMHDPRLYYGRPAYGQGVQNFGQAQQTHHAQTQPQQADVIHHRMTALSQPHQILHQDQQLHQVAAAAAHRQTHQALHHQSHLGGGQHQSASNQNQPSLLSQHPIQQQNQASPAQALTTQPHAQGNNRPLSSIKVSPQHNTQKQVSTEVDNLPVKPTTQMKVQLDYEQKSLATAATQQQQSTQLVPHNLHQNTSDVENGLANAPSSQKLAGPVKEPTSQPPNSLSPGNKPVNSQTMMKNDTSTQYPRKTQTNTLSQLQSRNIYRSQQQEERDKTLAADMAPKKTVNSERENRITTNVESKTQAAMPATKQQQESEQSATLEDSMASLAINASRKTTWASIASQPAKVSQPKSLKSKIAGSNSALSSAKHLAPVSLDSSSLESKNGINPAIKSSVSAAATSIQRSSMPPPVSKITSAIATSLKLDLLGEESVESSRISWPAVNASINLKLDDPQATKESPLNNSINNSNSYNAPGEKHKKDDGYRPRDFREPVFRDHNHNQGSNAKMVNPYQPPHGAGRDIWNRREQREFRIRRDSDRKEPSEPDKQLDRDSQPDNSRDMMNSRREFKPSGGMRANHFRSDDQYRDRDRDRERGGDFNNKRGMMPERNNDGYQNSRFPVNNRYDTRDSRESHQQHHDSHVPHGNRREVENQHTQHHHYNNVRDGNTAVNHSSKLDLNLHPHLNPANFNPKTFNLEPKDARYFIIKSYSEDDIHRSIKYSIWCSTNHGNKRLDEAYRQQQAKDGPIYLFFSVNGSGHFCGMAQMMSSVDFDSSSGVWAQSKWQGEFTVKWTYVKDVPNSALRHITLENNEDKPVTNSRDTQEVPSEKGKAVLKILHQYHHTTSIFDDFLHYERRQEEEKFKKSHMDQNGPHRSEERERGGPNPRFSGRNPRGHNDFQGNHRERPFRFAS